MSGLPLPDGGWFTRPSPPAPLSTPLPDGGWFTRPLAPGPSASPLPDGGWFTRPFPDTGWFAPAPSNQGSPGTLPGFDTFFNRFNQASVTGPPLVGPLEISSTNGTIIVNAPLARGITPEQVDVSIKDNILYVTVERADINQQTAGRFQRFQRNYESFSSSAGLPAGVDPGGMVETYQNGMLTVTIPKTP